jgi:hypothetical protein
VPRGPWRIGLTAAAAALLLGFQLPRCLNYLDQFKNDSRLRLRDWLAQNVKPGTGVLEEQFVGLSGRPSWGMGWYQRDTDDDPVLPPVRVNVTDTDFFPSRGELEDLAYEGISYVVVSDLSYARYLDRHVLAAPYDEDRFNERRQGYLKLLTQHQADLVWKSVPSPNMHAFTNPELRVYKVPQPKPRKRNPFKIW